MAYIGRNPAIGTQKVLDSLESQFNGSLTTFDLRYNTNTIYPPIASALIVSLGGVLQEPGVAYTVASDTITFASAPPTGTDCWILLYTEFGGIAGATANLTVSNNLTIGNELYGPANFVIDPATIGNNTGTVEIKGNLTVQGTTTTINSTTVDLDHLSLDDDEIANFGTDNDIQIVHESSGNKSVIKRATTGDLYLQGASGSWIHIEALPGESSIKAAANGTVQLFYDNYKRLETTNAGITLTSDSDLSTAGPEFKLYRDSASPADADYLGQIKFAGESDTGVERNYAKITGKILDASNGTEDGIIEFTHIKAGSETVTGRWRSDSLQLLNSTQLTVNGGVTFDSTLTVADDVVIGGTTAVGKLTLAGDGKDIVFGRTQNSGTGGVGRLVATGNIVYLQAGANASSGSAADLVVGAYGGVSERLRILSGGDIGIGTVSPTGKVQIDTTSGGRALTVNAPTLGTYLTFETANTAYADIGSEAGLTGSGSNVDMLTLNARGSRSLSFRTNSNERLRITSTGKVGINQGIPTADLEIVGTAGTSSTVFINAATHSSTVANEAVLKFGYSHSGSPEAVSEIKLVEDSANSFNGSLVFRVPANNGSGGSSTSEAFRIKHDGKVSISSDGTADGLLTIKGNSDATAIPSIRLLDGTDTREVSISNTAGDFVATTHGTDNNAHGQIKIFESGIILFSNGGANSSFTERLRIDTDGDILQTWRQDAFIGQKYQYNSTTYYGGLEIDMGSSRSLGIVARSDDTRADIFFKTGLSTTATEKMRITYAGKVGIGHASAAQIAKELTIRPVNDGGIRLIRPGATGSNPMYHLDITTTTSGQTFPNGEAYTVKYYTNNNDQIFSTRRSGGTGGNISFQTSTDGGTITERVLITPAGNVGVGTDDPDKKLHVEGDARVTGTLTVGTSTKIINGAHEHPTIRPVLDLNFAATKTLDRRITFTRDSIGTYTDEMGIVRYASNNVPRFDHDPTTRESLGLLIEESRTNDFAHSDPGNGAWIPDNGAVKTANTTDTAAPDGSFTATKIASQANANSYSQIYDSLNKSSGGIQSLWAKKGTHSVIGIYDYSGSAGIRGWFDLNTGEHRCEGGSKVAAGVQSNGNDNNSTNMVEYPNGWYRCIYYEAASMTYAHLRICDFDSDSEASSSSNTIYLWGLQAEVGKTFVTSFIPSLSGLMPAENSTRAVDTAIIKGTNFTDFYNASESTIFFESGVAPVTNSKYFTFHGSDGGGTELIESAAVSGPGANIFTYSNSTVWSNISVTDASATTLKSAAGIKANDINLAVNGTLGTTDTSSQQPDALDKLIIGNYSSGNYYINTCIKKLSYYNKRLPNAQLQGLTAL